MFEVWQTIETKRLIIRPFADDDILALYEIMKKPEVMYAWEHGFSLVETTEYLHRQQERYNENGFGEQAVFLKSNGKLIGAAGLLKLDLEGQAVTEIGYIFDNSVWGNGYATEAAKAFVDMAFDELGLGKLHCTIRPENVPSVKVAQRLGFQRVGEYVKVYNGITMPHSIYILEKEQRDK